MSISGHDLGLDGTAFEIEADTVQGARELAQLRVPDGCRAEIDVLCDGKPQPKTKTEIRASASSEGMARNRARGRMPGGLTVVSEHVIPPATRGTAVGLGADEVRAELAARRDVPKGMLTSDRKVTALEFERSTVANTEATNWIAAQRWVEELQAGLGPAHRMARGLCFKPRPAIGKYPDGPLAAGERYALTVTSTSYEPTWDAAYLAKVDYNLWMGPAPEKPFNRNRFHYNWHWHWDYGNGDSGNQGPHQFDIARWGLRKQEHPVKIASTGGYFGAPSSQETPDTQTSFFEYADGAVMEFATRGGFTNTEGDRTIGNLFYGEKGWLWIEESGRRWQSYFGPKNELGPGTERPGAPPAAPVHPAPHPQNFVDAIRAGDASKLTCNVLEGHLSSTPCRGGSDKGESVDFRPANASYHRGTVLFASERVPSEADRAVVRRLLGRRGS